ncbi:MAG: hypothetical protein EB084_19815 [Proteobacteria bacterium]|nr:hypothetical protein [Pseudomonadota bacterium]
MTQSSSSPLLLVNKLAPPLALFLFEAFVMQSPLGFVSIIGALCGLGSVAIQVYQKTLPKNIAAIAALVWLLVPVATFGFNAYNNQLAQTRAQQVIAACEDYRAANGRYPRSLSDLVPRYFPEVPRAKIGGMYGSFMYITGEKSTLLIWTVVPPFYRFVWNFEEKRWGHFD